MLEVASLLHGFSTSSNPSSTAVCAVVLTLFYGDVYDTERSQAQVRDVLARATERTRRVVAMVKRCCNGFIFENTVRPSHDCISKHRTSVQGSCLVPARPMLAPAVHGGLQAVESRAVRKTVAHSEAS